MVEYHKSFVLLKVRPGHEMEVIDSLLKIAEVEEAHIIPGEWDVLAIVNAKGMSPFKDEKVYWITLEKINKIKNIKDSQTLVPQYSKTKES